MLRDGAIQALLPPPRWRYMRKRDICDAARARSYGSAFRLPLAEVLRFALPFASARIREALHTGMRAAALFAARCHAIASLAVEAFATARRSAGRLAGEAARWRARARALFCSGGRGAVAVLCHAARAAQPRRQQARLCRARAALSLFLYA